MMENSGKPRILVIGSCTGRKRVSHERALTLEDFRDPERLRDREMELARHRVPAGRLYTGLQHTLMMSGVSIIRRTMGHESVTVKIVSAGYGLVAEDRLLAPYEVTFNTMGKRELRAWAGYLGIGRDVRAAAKGFPLVFFLLGSRYLEAIEPPILPGPGQRLVYLGGEGDRRIAGGNGVTVVPAGPEEARLYRSPIISVKGRMFQLLGQGLALEGPGLWESLLRDDTPATFRRGMEAGRRWEIEQGV